MNTRYFIVLATIFILGVTLTTGCLSNSLGSNVSKEKDYDGYMAESEDIIDNSIINNVDIKMPQIPLVKSVQVSLVYATSAVISWETDIESDGYIEYGNNELYGMSSYVNTEQVKYHRMQLQNLQPNTTYYFRIISSHYSLEGTKSYSQGYHFTTERE